MVEIGSIRVNYTLLYSAITMAILIIGAVIFCSTYSILVILTSKISDTFSMLISIGIMIASCKQTEQNITFVVIILVAIFIFLGIVLSLSGVDFNDVVVNKEAMSQHYFYAYSVATIIFMAMTAVILYCCNKEIKRLKDVNALFTRYVYVYEKMPSYAKKSGLVLNEHGVQVIAEDEFTAFMDRYYLICDLPYEERDPSKWDQKNIGRYFSLQA